ncbi:MAG TPA: hypothetical protein VEX40_18505 [Mycobacterium sp.]|nr:hypothetical protein [Mycobacterium sp.]
MTASAANGDARESFIVATLVDAFADLMAADRTRSGQVPPHRCRSIRVPPWPRLPDMSVPRTGGMSARTSDSSPATFSASPRVSRMCWQKALSDEQITELNDRRVAAFRETRIAGVTAI